MAITSSNSSTATETDNPVTLKTKKTRAVLTSPFFKKNRMIKKIYSGEESAPVGCYYPTVKDPVTGKTKKQKLQVNPKASPEMIACQKAMYIILTDIDRIRKRANQTVLMAESSQLYKQNFSGILDGETQVLVGRMQNAFNSYYASKGVNISITVDNRIGPVTLEEMDKRLEMIKYYNTSDQPFIYHSDYVCTDADYMLRPHKPITYLYELPSIPPQNPEAYVKKRKGTNGLPEPITLLQYRTKIIIMRNVDNYSQGWFYAKVLLQKPNSDEYYFEDGYINRLDLLQKLRSMPDPDAELILIPAAGNGGTVSEIIKEHYTHNDKNSFGMSFVQADPGIFGGDEAHEAYACFKFYANLLLYTNNPEAVNSGDDSIYLVSAQPLDNAWLDMINNKRNYVGVPRGNASNYRYFLELVKHFRNNAYWEFLGENTIKTIQGSHMWIPSPQFANHLYAVINDNRSFLSEIANLAIAKIRDNWPRGFGVEIDGSLAVTFGFPTAKAGMKLRLSRKHTATNNEVILVIEKEGALSGGLEAGYGAALKLSAGRRPKDADEPSGILGANASVGAQGGIALNVEYEFPIVVSDDDVFLQNDYVLWPLLTTFLSVAVNPMELIGNEFLKAFTDNNLNPNNYITKLSITHSLELYAGAAAGFGIGDSDGEDLWEQPLDDELDTKEKNPWDIKNLAALLNLKLGASVSAKFALGFTYEATYDEFSFDRVSQKRVPLSCKLAVITNSSLSESANLQIANMVIPIMDYEPNASFELSMRIERPNSVFTPSLNYVVDEDTPRLTLLAGYGNWSITNHSSTMLGVVLKKMTQVPQSIPELVNHIDYFSLWKRISISKMQATSNMPVIARKKAKNVSINSLGISLGNDAFYEIEFRIPNEVVLTMFDELVYILQKTKHDLYDAVQNISWISVTSSFANNLTPMINTKTISSDLKTLYKMLLNKFAYESIGRHAEKSFSISIGGKVSFLAKLSLELSGQAVLSYDKSYMADQHWRILSPSDENIECNRLKEYFEYPGVKEYLLGL